MLLSPWPLHLTLAQGFSTEDMDKLMRSISSWAARQGILSIADAGIGWEWPQFVEFLNNIAGDLGLDVSAALDEDGRTA